MAQALTRRCVHLRRRACNSLCTEQGVVSQSLAQSTLYSDLLFKCAAGISASSSSFFWQGLHFRMMPMFFLPFAFTYLLVGRSCRERTSVMNQSTRCTPAGSCAVQPAGAGRHWDAATTDHVGRTTLPPARTSKEIRTADTATACQALKALREPESNPGPFII